MGLSQPHARQRATTTPRRPTPTIHPAPACCRPHDVHDVLSEQVLLVHVDEERGKHLRHFDKLHFQRRYAAGDDRSALYNGAATGSPITRYIHPDHLGSTNAVTDQNGNLVQLHGLLSVRRYAHRHLQRTRQTRSGNTSASSVTRRRTSII